MLKNDILLRAAKGQMTERPPVWLMRQAGRILPQYRALRASLSGFKELVETPELACEVTIQPVDELDVDAAIIFSDILVIPDCMGLTYEMIKGKGPFFPNTIETKADIDSLIQGDMAAQELHYVYDAIRITKKELNDRVPLIGFAGAPFTILCYMLEGQGSKTFSKAKRLLYKEPELAHLLLQKITDTTIAYTQKQIEAGADLIQIFDSWAGVLDARSFQTYSLPYMKQIVDGLSDKVPVTLFAKEAWHSIQEMADTQCSVLGLSWTQKPGQTRKVLGEKIVLQGNLDPCILYGSDQLIKERTSEMIQQFGGRHIVNLGHGVYPDTPLEGVKCFVNTVKSYSY